MLYIRTDGNAKIGIGHIMRCLSIAKTTLMLGEDCTFITSDKHMESLLLERGFHMICLDSCWSSLDSETDKMVSLISEKHINKLLVDSYFVTEQYLQRLCGLTSVAYMDDLNAFHYACHMLINYSIYANKFDYHTNYPDTKLLLGPKYTPLRDEFQNLPEHVINEQVKSVLVTTGGSDPFNVAGKLVKMAKESPNLNNLKFHIVAGQFNASLPMLRQLALEFPGITVHENVQNMSGLMLACDIAVSAGGSTTYELCACGTPSIVFACADNQLDGVSAFSRNIMLGAGDLRGSESACLDNLVTGIKRLKQDLQLRRTLSRKSRALVDGMGAGRVAKELCSLY